MTYVLRDKETGKYVALDSASGGYPYLVDDILRAKFWDTPENAARYTAVMGSKSYDNPPYVTEQVHISTTVLAHQYVGQELENLRRN